MSRILVSAFTLLSIWVNPLLGQEQRSTQADDGPVAFLLEHRERLGLKAEQITRLEEINNGLVEENRPLLVQMRGIRGQIRALGPRERLSPEATVQFEAYLAEVRSVMERMQKNNWSAMEDVGEVLTHLQKRRLARLIGERGNSVRGRSGDLYRHSSPRN